MTTIDELKYMYLGREEEKLKAFNKISEYNINVLESNDISFLHIKYCIDNGFYNDAIYWGEKAIKKYPRDLEIQEIVNPIVNNDYDKKSKNYNKKKKNYCFEDCCYFDCCDCYTCCDSCVQCRDYDSGCCDIKDLCFIDC